MTLADYRYAVELMLRRRDNERDRLDRIDAKVAPIIGGTIAALGRFIDNASSLLDVAVGAARRGACELNAPGDGRVRDGFLAKSASESAPS